MKKLTLLFLLMVCTAVYQSASAQNVKLQMGPEYKLGKITQQPSGFVYGDNNCIYLLRNNINLGSVYGAAYASYFSFGLAKTKIKSTASLEKYDSKFALAFNKYLSSNLKDMDLKDVVKCKDKFIALTSHYDKQSKTNTAFASGMNDDGDFNGTPVTLMNLQGDTKSHVGDFDFCVSYDSSKILVYANMPEIKKDERKIIFDVYNNNLEKLWEKIVTLPYTNKMSKEEAYGVSNEGDVYVLVKKYEGESAKESRKGDKGREANYHFEVLGYLNQGNDYKEFDVDLGGKFAVDPTFRIDPKGNLAFAGFYSDKNGGPEKGVFYMTIDAQSKAVKAISTKEFPSDLIEAFKKRRDERQGHGDKAGLRYFVFHNFIMKPDGGATILAQNQYVERVEQTSHSGGMTTTSVHFVYHYNDIIAISINPQGNVDWISVIPKMQVSTVDLPSMSFARLLVGDKIHLIYNDNPKNLAAATGKNPKGSSTLKNSVAIIATIDANGKVSKKLLFDPKDKNTKTVMCTKLSEQITPNTLAIYMQKGKTYRIGSVTVD